MRARARLFAALGRTSPPNQRLVETDPPAFAALRLDHSVPCGRDGSRTSTWTAWLPCHLLASLTTTGFR